MQKPEHEIIEMNYIAHHNEQTGKKIRKSFWMVFWILLVVTIVEVIMGVFGREWALPWGFIKRLFIALTIVKAYYIIAYFMHMRDEHKNLSYIIMIPFFLLIPFLIYILIDEALFIVLMGKT